jgi:hypothetical protein
MRRGLRHHVRYGHYRPYRQNFLWRCNNICSNSQFWFTKFFMSAFILRAYAVRDFLVHDHEWDSCTQRCHYCCVCLKYLKSGGG